MTELQEKVKSAIEALNDTTNTEWGGVVDAVNELCVAIENGEAYYDAGFPPELKRAFDHGANLTAWIYTRLESAAKSKRRTGTKIRKAMGYQG